MAKKAAAKKPGSPKKAAKKPVAKSPTKKPVAKSPTKKPQPAKPLPSVAVKPKKATAPSLPLPPPPPPPPAQRDELAAPRDIARLLRYGETFGAHKIDVRMLPLQLPVPSGTLALLDPLVPKSFRVFDRPVPAGTFRVMLSVAKSSDKERLAAIVIHTGRPPIARWTVAHYAKQKRPASADALPRTAITGDYAALIDGAAVPGPLAVPSTVAIVPVEIPLTDGRRALAIASGKGEFAAYWGVDADDKPVCLVIDFDVFTQKDWKAKPR